LALGIAAAACAGGRPDARPQGAALAPAAATPAAPPNATPTATAIATTTPNDASTPARAPGPRTIGRCDAPGGVQHFTIAHFNDLQARYSDRLAGKSRYAYIAGYLRHLKQDQPHTIVLDAGDDYEKGAVAELRSMGEATRQMIQALPIDARTIGNHDFAYGEEAVLRDVRQSAHPVLAANVRHKGLADAEQPLGRFVRIDVGCVRVGVVGLVTQSFGADDQPSKEPFDGVFEQDPKYAQALAREIAAHRSEVDVMIALTHLGLWSDTVLAMSPLTRGLDMIVGAHTEDLLPRPLSLGRPDGSRTWIVQAGHFGKMLGRADVAFDPRDRKLSIDKYKIVEVDATMPVADDVADLADRLEQAYAPDAQRPVATTEAPIDRREMPGLFWRAAQTAWEADALVVGRDLFWEGLPRGPVTLQRLYDAVLVQRQPAGTSGFSSVWVVEMTGAELDRYKRRFRPSGFYDMFAPAKIEATQRYRVALDKRVLTYPRTILGDAKLAGGPPAYAGEMIDALEAYARARTLAGKPLE
jgi:2',3'-cyclic-nucleotide 2'-phosphodiesterase (5'-nucleotidase family)